jgi:hypothetical protein
MFAAMHQFWQENQPVIRKNDEPVQFALVKAEEPKA